jgi:predicted nucleic acid-binding protein
VIVVDASAVVDALAFDDHAHRRQLSEDDLHTTQHVEVEVANALRRLVAAGELDADHGEALLVSLPELQMRQHPAAPLLERIWQLRHNVTPYDATYVALAELLGCPLLTADARLAASPGLRCEVQLVEG